MVKRDWHFGGNLSYENGFLRKTSFLPLSEFLVSNLEIELAEDESDSRLLAVSPLEVSTTAHAFTLS